MFVRLTAAFLEGICTDHDPAHPHGPDVIITKGQGDDRPAFEVTQNPYIKDKIREGILEEVRDFDGTPRNDPAHPDHPDNPDNQHQGDAGAVQGYTDADVQRMIAQALAQQSERTRADQDKAIDAAVTKALAAQSPKSTS